MNGPLAVNEALAAAELIARGRINGPEDMAIDRHGRIFAGTAEGHIVRVDTEGAVTVLADTAVRAHDLDEAEALKAKEKAEQALKDKTSDMEYARAQADLAEAAAQLRMIQKLRKTGK